VWLRSPFNLAPQRFSWEATKDSEKAQKESACRLQQSSGRSRGQRLRSSVSQQRADPHSRGLVTVYIVFGVLYESYIIRSHFVPRCPSAGVGAILALLICGSELSGVALIGIILLIGIVKKNGIMMIDFALEAGARREESREAIYQAWPIALPSHHDDNHGRCWPACRWPWEPGSVRECAAACISHGGGFDLEPDTHLVYDPVIYIFFGQARDESLRAPASSESQGPGTRARTGRTD